MRAERGRRTDILALLDQGVKGRSRHVGADGSAVLLAWPLEVSTSSAMPCFCTQSSAAQTHGT